MRSLQGRLLVAVGVLVVVAVGAVALALRRDTRREFLRFQDVDRRSAVAGQATLVARAVAALDGACCDAAALEDAAAVLPRHLLIVVFDSQGMAIAHGGGPAASLADLHATTRNGLFAIEAVRQWGNQRERIALQIPARGSPIRLADGRSATVEMMPIPDAERAARVDAFLDTLDRRILLLTGTVGALALLVTIVVARSTIRPLEDLRRATAALTSGAYEQRVRVAGPREVADLAADFNTLALRLEQQHALRRALTNDVAHELRTPLTALQCRLESVIDGVAADPVAACRALSDDVRHLARLVDDLQDVALAEARELRLQIESVSLHGVLVSVLDTLGLAGTPRVEVAVAPGLLVRADSARLRQVLLNLVGNAQRHAPADARIFVRARQAHQEVLTEVENWGSAIPAAHLPHVFDRFTRVDPARQRDTGGTGLGLAIVKHLVEAQGGRVWAASTGDTVTIGVALPAALLPMPAPVAVLDRE
jgi:signal transduction histidine kinase